MLLALYGFWYSMMHDGTLVTGGYLLTARMCCVAFQFLALAAPLELLSVMLFSRVAEPGGRGFFRFLRRVYKDVPAWFGNLLDRLAVSGIPRPGMVMVSFFLSWQALAAWMCITGLGVSGWRMAMALILPLAVFSAPCEAFMLTMLCGFCGSLIRTLRGVYRKLRGWTVKR